MNKKRILSGTAILATAIVSGSIVYFAFFIRNSGNVNGLRIVAAAKEYTEFAEAQLRSLASPAYLDRFGEPLTPEDLMRHRCIGYVDPASGRLWEWYFGTPDDGVFSMELPCPLAMAQGELRRRAAVAGFGIINDIDHFTAPLVQQGLLTPMLARWTMPQPICHVSYPGDRYRSGRINAFLAHLKQWFARQPPAGT